MSKIDTPTKVEINKMPLECVTNNPIYRTSVEQKLHSKNAAKLYRYGSPKLRDQLREQCRKRVREARQASFSRRRLADIPENFNFDVVMREELAGLESDLRLQEEIFKELHDEMNEWFVAQCEAEDAYLLNIAQAEADPSNVYIVCPICQLDVLSCSRAADELYNVYSCVCGVHFNFPADIVVLRSTLLSKIDAHEQCCSQQLCFFLEPQSVSNVLAASGVGGNTLSAMCGECDYFCSL